MADDPNPSVEDKNFKLADAGTIPTDDLSPGANSENKPCCHNLKRGRNLIVCIDGTANQFGEKNTNVIELYNRILKEVTDKQRTWYNSGIGTYARPSWASLNSYLQVISHKIDLAIAWNFERTVLGAYRWLSDNYKPGDCIFLFGFSRGAFQVRVLSAMIDKVGLIHKGNEMQIPFAYQLYRDPKSNERSTSVTQVGSSQKTPDGQPLMTSSAERFKNAFSRKDVKVHFVGAWDIVSSIGIIRGSKMLPGTIDGMKHVCYFRHALALDERRVKFLPEYAYGGSANPSKKPKDKNTSTATLEITENDKNPSAGDGDEGTTNDPTQGDEPLSKNGDTADRSQLRNKSTKKPPHTLEVWFAGTHSDIGGGNVENARMDRSRPPLRWMVFEAGKFGLRTAPFDRELPPSEQIEIKESLTKAWWPFELLFFKRLTYTRQEHGKQITHKPHLGSGRKIHLGQKIHSSLMLSDKTRQQYTPKARPPSDDPRFWEIARTKGLGGWLELDLYEYAQNLVEKFIGERDSTALQTLRQTAASADGRQAVCETLYKEAIRVLKNSALELEVKYQFLHPAVDILTKSIRYHTHLKLDRSVDMRPLVSDLRESSEKHYQEIAQQFLEQCTDHCILTLIGHTNLVFSVSFSPDGRRVVSGSGDSTVRIWDAETGKPVGEPFRGCRKIVWSVSFSPDGKRVVSGSGDETVRIWDAETGKPVGEPFQGHRKIVWSVAFSPDGRRVVSASGDGTVRIWDTETGKQVGEPFQGQTEGVNSVAFSPDGRRIVSGSDDKTVRIWNAETGKQLGVPFQGHIEHVISVAFSPDGRRVASGSDDNTVRIWNAETGKQLGVPFRGHTEHVMSVAFSADGRRVVSGSDDKTVRIWNAETGKQVGEPFRGHTDWVRSVAFSPDGRRVVSGSDDKTVRIWDAET